MTDSVPTGSIKRKIYFSRIVFKNGENQVNPVDVFTRINSLSYNNDGRYLTLEDGNIWSMFIDSSSMPLKIRMGTIRKKGLPLVEKRGETSLLELPVDSGLYEPMHFMIFPNNIVAFEYNFYGPRINNLQHYVRRKAQGIVDSVDIFPLMTRDVSETISKIGEIKLFRIGVHRDMEAYLAELDESLPAALEALKRTSDANYIEIILRQEKYSRENIALNFLNKLASWLPRAEVQDGVDAMKVKAINNITNRTQVFDLLQEFLLSEKQVVKIDEIHRSVDSGAMYSAIIGAHSEQQNEINRIIQDFQPE